MSVGIWQTVAATRRTPTAECGIFLTVLTLLFAQPLVRLFSYASSHDLHSHIPLIPLVTGYLLWMDRRLRGIAVRRSPPSALGFLILGVAALTFGMFQPSLSVNDQLAALTAAYLNFAIAGAFLFLGASWMSVAAFPVAFLIFMIPLPDAVVHWVEMRLVAASADAAAFLISVTGTPLLRDGTVLALPGVVLEVARECSGIRSTWVLFITSVLAAHLFLQHPMRKIVLIAFVIPLGIIRNGFRILVIGLLCVHIGPEMVDSPIHRRGGPLFFIMSLVPFFLLVLCLHRRERHRLDHAAIT